MKLETKSALLVVCSGWFRLMAGYCFITLGSMVDQIQRKLAHVLCILYFPEKSCPFYEMPGTSDIVSAKRRRILYARTNHFPAHDSLVFQELGACHKSGHPSWFFLNHLKIHSTNIPRSSQTSSTLAICLRNFVFA